jgi:hypothetical protein
MRRIALAAAFALTLTAATPDPAPLAWMHGEWSGNGEMFGRTSSVMLSIKPALRDSVTELHYVADLPVGSAAPAFHFEGKGVYKIGTKGKVTGQWSDSEGNFHAIGGSVSAGRMVTVWGQPSTEIGRSVYALDDKGELTVSDSVLTPDGGWRIFATARYRRR